MSITKQLLQNRIGDDCLKCIMTHDIINPLFNNQIIK
jgi:hypothetical protein